ncbi:hypothetical protein FOCC_FOCC000749 [Frankliniella occidentalis]|uniref:Cytochrome c oxidase subunit 4 n=1 Tax=Frankliniella occidentalis TaxID=133901 RepID=A0A6J1S1U7_FRAOC|nr:cytochrome c oxidase subunit 4 isoform 1, mitochondrial-like [Frankliniella occidentalis]KAE8752627.1 hypothetical protein FOCC_FOCC000749 [Frankliniella occidentalis]
MALKLRTKLPQLAQTMARQMSSHDIFYHDQRELCGNREIVGHGKSGKYTYYDGHDLPFPAIRFRPDDAASKALREKEKGDWKNLTLEEKKTLYRHSFCQTFVEMDAPDPEWKAVLGYTLIGVAVAWGMYLTTASIMPEHPYREFFDAHETRVASEQRKLDRGTYKDKDFTGWDYENRKWKE